MSSLGKYKIPTPFKDEDKWLKYFTKKQLMYIGFGLMICLPLLKLTWTAPSLLKIPVMVFCIIVMGTALIIGMATMPDDKYLWGGGTKLDKLLFRIIRKRLKSNKVLYVKNYKEEPDKNGGHRK